MAELRFIGYKGISVSSRLIRWYTNGDFSHVEQVVNFDTLAGYGANYRGVDFYSLKDHIKGTEYEVWSLICTESQKADFDAFMKLQYKKPYDYKGLLGFPMHSNINDANSWFCSELLAVGCLSAKIPLFNWHEAKPGLISPSVFALSPLLRQIQKGKT